MYNEVRGDVFNKGWVGFGRKCEEHRITFTLIILALINIAKHLPYDRLVSGSERDVFVDRQIHLVL